MLRRTEEAIDMSDEEATALLMAAQAGHQEAVERTFSLARQTVEARLQQTGFRAPGLTVDDFFQEASLALMRGVRLFDPEKSPAKVFVWVIVTRSIDTTIKQATRNKHEILSRAVPIDVPYQGDNKNRVSGEELAAEGPSPEALLTLQAEDDDRAALWAAVNETAIYSDMSELEWAVYLSLFCEDDPPTYEELAEALGRNVKSIDNARCKIIRKLRSNGWLQERYRRYVVSQEI